MIKKLLAELDTLKYILFKGGITFLLRMIGMAFSFLIMWFMTHYYGEATYGLYSLAFTILQLTGLFFALGLPGAFISFTGGYENESQHRGLLVKSIKIGLISAVLPIIVFLVGPDVIAEKIFEKPNLHPYIRIIALGIPGMILHELICFYFMAVKKFVAYGLFIFILPNLFLIISLFFLYKYNPVPYLTFLAYVFSILLTIVIGMIVIFVKRPKIAYPVLTTKDILRRSFPMMMSGIFVVLLNWTDILMLGHYESESQIGIYNAAFKIGYLSLFFVASMNVIILPKVSELFYQKNIKEMKKVVNRSTQLVILLTLPLALILIVFSKTILGFVGQETVSGSTTLILITLGGLFNAMTGNVDQILNMTNNQKTVSLLFFLGFVLNVLLNIFLIPAYGIEGAATASLISNIVVNTVFVIVIRVKIGFYTFI